MATSDYETDYEETSEDDFFLPNTETVPTSSTTKRFLCQTTAPRAIILLMCAVIFLLSFAGHLMGVPVMRIYEDIICHHHYEGEIKIEERIDEKLCKGEEVQNQLNLLLGVMHFLGAIPGLATTIPYGLLADRIGRKPVLVLSVCGLLLSSIYNMSIMYFWKCLPIRLVWIGPLFSLIGGGEAVLGMMFYAIGSDVTTDANRGTVFLFGASAGIVAGLISPPITSVLMEKYSPWVPLLIGFVVLSLGMFPALFISETLHLRPSSTTPDFLTPERDFESYSTVDKTSSFLTLLKVQIVDGLRRIHDSAAVIRSLPIFLLLIPFITTPFGRQSMDLSLRYISKRFSWMLSQTLFLLSLVAIVNLVLLGAFLPALSYYLTECRKFSAKEKDLVIAQGSVVLLVLGSLLMAISPDIGLTIFGLVIVTLGTGFVSMVRSLITTMVDSKHVARLYAAIAAVETSASLIASPAVAGMYALGLKWKGLWIGLPFFGVAVICIVGGVGVWSFRFLKNPQEETAYSGEDDRETLVGSLAEDTSNTGVIHLV